MRRAILISLGIVALVTGCGGGSSEPSASGEWTRHDIRDGNASVALPAEWKALEDFDAKTIENLIKEDERVAPYVDALVDNDAFKLWALDPDIREAFATNLNVIVAPVGVPLRDWVTRENASTKRLAVRGSLKSTFVRTPAGEAARITCCWTSTTTGGGSARCSTSSGTREPAMSSRIRRCLRSPRGTRRRSRDRLARSALTS